MRASLRRFFAGLLALGLVHTGTCSAAEPDKVTEFYKNNNLHMIIGYSVGGGYDLYARLLARHLGSFLPGQPTIVPQNMPGAGSLKAAIYLSTAAPKDGSTIGTVGRTVLLDPLLQGAKFDPRKLSWLGSITSDVSLCVTWASSPVKTLDDLLTKDARLGGQGVGSDPDVYATVLKKMLGAKLQLVSGYPGNSELGLAMERGEIDGYCGLSYSSLVASHPDWIREHKVNILLQAGLEKSPELPATPSLLEKVTDPKQKAALKVLLSAQTIARPFAAPPGVPEAQLTALRQAFEKTVRSTAFLEEARKIGLDVNPVSYNKVEELLSEAYATPTDVIAIAKEAMSR
jgi:tripartite-type tricarboxylate transporter receptor subunit TctC